jgi:hypothetical protein
MGLELFDRLRLHCVLWIRKDAHHTLRRGGRETYRAGPPGPLAGKQIRCRLRRRDLSGTQECRKPGRRSEEEKNGKHGRDAEVEEKRWMPRRRHRTEGNRGDEREEMPGTKGAESTEHSPPSGHCLSRSFPCSALASSFLNFLVFVLFCFIPSSPSLLF